MKELTGIIRRLIFEKTQPPKKISGDWKEANSTPIIKKTKKIKQDPDNYRTVSFTSVSAKGQNRLKAISKHMKDKVMESRVYQGQIMLDLLLFFLERGDWHCRQSRQQWILHTLILTRPLIQSHITFSLTKLIYVLEK